MQSCGSVSATLTAVASEVVGLTPDELLAAGRVVRRVLRRATSQVDVCEGVFDIGDDE